MIFVNELEEGVRAVSFSQVRSKQIRAKKDGSSYIRLLLGDRTGEVEARIWDDVDDCRNRIQEGDLVKYIGVAEVYNGVLQLIVRRIRRVEPKDREEGFDPTDVVARTEHDIEKMWSRLRELVNGGCRRPAVLQLLNSVLDGHAERIKSYPAGTEVHHNYWGGFLEHVLSVLESVLFFARKYPELDGDLLIAGAVLHDIGKLEELRSPENPAYSTQGVLIGHIVLGRDLLMREASRIPEFPSNFRLLLEHVILSHQGQLEWGSPKRPKIPEALVLHYVDDLDAKLNRFLRVLKEDAGNSEFTRYDRFLQRALFKGEYDPPSPVPSSLNP